MTELTTIGGMIPALAQRLQRLGVRSVEDLLQKGATLAGRKEMAELAVVDPAAMLALVKRANSMHLRALVGPYAPLVVAAGVDSVYRLAGCDASELVVRLAEANRALDLVEELPDAALVATWVSRARLPGRQGAR